MSQPRLQLVAPVKVLCDRLTRDMAMGDPEKALAPGPLAYLTWAVSNTPEKVCTRLGGENDLPCIQVIDYTDEEKGFSGGKSTSQRQNTNSTNLVASARITFLLSVSREQGGLYNPAGDGTGKTRGLIEWVSFIRDSLNKNNLGNIDGQLNGTCLMPFTVSVKETNVMDLSWEAGIEVEFHPLPFVRGTVTDTLETAG